MHRVQTQSVVIVEILMAQDDPVDALGDQLLKNKQVSS